MTFKDCKNAGSCEKTLCLPEFCHEFDRITKTNAEIIREKSDEELAEFLADRLAKENCKQLYGEGYILTATQIEAIKHTQYCYWMQWLRSLAEEVDK